LKEHFGDRVGRVESRSARQSFVDVDAGDVVEVARFLFNEMGGRLATVTGIDARDCAEILYHWCIDEVGAVVTVRAKAAKPDLKMPSITGEIVGARWIEREIHDLLGVVFEGHPNLKRLILADDWPEGVYPLRRDFRE